MKATFCCEIFTLSDEHPGWPGRPILYSSDYSSGGRIEKIHEPSDSNGSISFGQIVAEWASKPSRTRKQIALAAAYCSRWPEGPQVEAR